MSFRSILSSLRSVPPLPRVRAAGRRPGFRPRLEPLDDRSVPATFTVLNLADAGDGSLRQAVLDANAQPGADTISFADGLQGTIALASELGITDDLTIDGLGEDQLTISGNDATRVFHISGSTTDVEITGLTIAHGSATGTTTTGPFGPVTLGGGILNNGGHLTVSHVTLTDNRVVGFNATGGAIANVAGATLAVAHSTFTGNEVVGAREAAGGGIANDAGSSLAVAHSTFTGNTAIGSDASAGTGVLHLGGGAISNRSGSQATVSHSTFAGNLARGANGANGGPAQNGGDGAHAFGGAIATYSDGFLGAGAATNLVVEHSAFTGNQAVGGAGGNGGAGKSGGNGGAGQGGAIADFSSTLSVRHSTFSDNQGTGGAGGNGGAGANGGGGGPGVGAAINAGVASLTPNLEPTVTVDHSTIDGNRATGGRGGNGGSNGNGGNGGVGGGGGIRARGPLNVAHSQLVLNQAVGGAGGDRGDGGSRGGTGGSGQGGGIVTTQGSTGTVFRTVLRENQASGGAGGLGGNGGSGQGGGIWNGTPNPSTGTPSTLTVLRSTIVGNRADGGAAGTGGTAGLGQGGGIYIVPGGTVCVDLFTAIFGNDASTSDDDVFGVLCFI